MKRATYFCKSLIDFFYISIHALVKRATYDEYNTCGNFVFQSTPS